MSTGPMPPVPTSSKLQDILSLINIALQGLALVPVIGAPAGLADVFLNILRGSLALYQKETGQPIDLTKIPLETPVP